MGKTFTRCSQCGADEVTSSPSFPAGPTEVKSGDTNMGEKYEEIRQRCLRTGTLYEDPNFLASPSVLHEPPNVPLYSIKWMRPKEISTKPVLFHLGPKYYDMHQGGLGNCWFVAAVCCVAASDHRGILTRVAPDDQGFGRDYCGAFHFFFWQFGEWEEVVIDDRLPTHHGGLLYAENKTYPDEYWCPLMEKAFAKLYGSYKAIHGNRLHNALVDLTGGIGEIISLDKGTDEELSEILLNCQKMNSIMGGAIGIKKSGPAGREMELSTGLRDRHAYSIVDVKVVSTKYGPTTLLHIRNPWGEGEWKGAWSDGSAEWYTLSPRDMYATYKTQNDGEFWISVSDFKKHFDVLELCHLTPDGLTEEIADNMARSNWHTTEQYGSWVEGLSAGGQPINFKNEKFWSNPQFELQIADAKRPATVVISLFEVDETKERKMNDISIAFHIFRFQDGRKPERITARNFYDYNPKVVKTSGIYWPYRERTVRFRMDPGYYSIIPHTNIPGQEAAFYMRIFSDSHVESRPLKPNEDQETIPMTPGDAAIEEKFDEFAKGAGVIDAAEAVHVFNAGLKAGEGKEEGFNLETCRCLIGLTAVQNPTGLLTKGMVSKIWSFLGTLRKVFRTFDQEKIKFIDTSELKKLVECTDFPTSQKIIDAIIKRYGDKHGKISEEDCIQSLCKTMGQYLTYGYLESHNKVNMDFDEWVSITMKM